MIDHLKKRRDKNPNKLQKMCRTKTEREIQKIRKGWVNKQKGPLQILFKESGSA